MAKSYSKSPYKSTEITFRSIKYFFVDILTRFVYHIVKRKEEKTCLQKLIKMLVPDVEPVRKSARVTLSQLMT